jgi:hypothetical protein
MKVGDDKESVIICQQQMIRYTYVYLAGSAKNQLTDINMDT